MEPSSSSIQYGACDLKDFILMTNSNKKQKFLRFEYGFLTSMVKNIKRELPKVNRIAITLLMCAIVILLMQNLAKDVHKPYLPNGYPIL